MNGALTTSIIRLMAAGFVLLPMLQQPAEPPDAERQKDVYAVYSAMISGRTLPMQNASDEIYLIQASTIEIQLNPEGCVKVPPADAAVLAEILADYNKRKNVTLPLEREFTLAKPYQLLSVSEAEKFMEDELKATPQIMPRGGVPPVNSNPLRQKAKTVLLLGGVFFNQNRTQALSYVGAYQTRYDFSTFWRALKKSPDGKWDDDRVWQACGRGGIR